MKECIHTESSGPDGESGHLQRVSQGQTPGTCSCCLLRDYSACPEGPRVLTFPQGAPILNSATRMGIEKGGCLGFGQASFVVFNKGIKKTRTSSVEENSRT